MQHRLPACMALFCAISTSTMPAPAAHAQGTIYNWGTSGGRASRLWVPDDLDTVRGILIVGNGAGGDERSQATATYNQRFAELHGFAVLATARWGGIDNNEIVLWERQLDQLANLSGHAELVHAPWAPIGLSNGGQMSWAFNALRPEKTLAYIANKGAFYYTPNLPANSPALDTPGILIAGENDSDLRKNNIRNLFLNNRPDGGLVTWVEQENVGHSRRANEIVFPLMSEAIRLRYPQNQAPTSSGGVTLNPLDETSGWLADTSSWTSGLTEIAPHASYTGNTSQAGWLMNEGMANLYRAFSTYNKDVGFDLSATAEVFWSHDNVLSFNDPLGITITVETDNVSDFSKVELFSYDQKLGEILGTGSPLNEVTFDVSVGGPGVHGLFALVTHADGITLSTTEPKAFIAIPEPTMIMLVIGTFVPLLRRRRIAGIGR